MKKYLALVIDFSDPIYSDPNLELKKDISKKAAMDYQMNKFFLKSQASPKVTTNDKSRQLPLNLPSKIQISGETGSKTVLIRGQEGSKFDIKMADDYVLIKPKNFSYAFFDEIVKEMISSGLSKTTVFIYNDNEQNKRKLYYFSPKLKGVNFNSASKDYSHLYFIQCFNEIKRLHYNGYCHYDIKPDNVIINQDSKTLTLIDFGSISRSWQRPSGFSDDYSIFSQNKYFSHDISKIKINDNEQIIELENFKNWNLNNSYNKFNTRFNGYQEKKQKGNIPKNQHEYKVFKHQAQEEKDDLHLIGVYHDMASLVKMGLKATGICDQSNLQLFKEALEKNCRPYYVQKIIENLQERVSKQNKLGFLYPKRHPIITSASAITINQDDFNELTPESLALEIKERNKNIEHDLKLQELQPISGKHPGQTAFEALSSIKEIYKINLINGAIDPKARKKHKAMSILILMLKDTKYRHEFSDLITRIFVISLINRRVVHKKYTDSFEKIYSKVNNGPFKSALALYWDGRVRRTHKNTNYTHVLSIDEFYDLLKSKTMNNQLYSDIFETKKRAKKLLGKTLNDIVEDFDYSNINNVITTLKENGLNKIQSNAITNSKKHLENFLQKDTMNERVNKAKGNIASINELLEGDKVVQLSEESIAKTYNQFFAEDTMVTEEYLNDIRYLYENPK